MPSCSACGFLVKPLFRFCPECGISAGALPKPPAQSPVARSPRPVARSRPGATAAGRTERKQVTVFLCDLCGSTEQVADFDPEQAQAHLERAVQLMRAGVTAFGGTLVQVRGDGLLAVFGAPLAQEDHALRACLAGIDIHHRATLAEAAQNATLAKAAQSAAAAGRAAALTMRVGLHSGEVLIGKAEKNSGSFYRTDGTAIHLAARLESLARPGTVLMSGATFRMVEGRIGARALGHHAIRGFATKVELFELAPDANGNWPADRRSADGSAVSHARQAVPIAGRSDVIHALRDIADAVLAKRRGASVIGLVGDAGFGKSRVLTELMKHAHASGFDVRAAHARSYASHVPFNLVAELMHALLGIASSQNPETARNSALLALRALPAEMVEHRSAALDLLNLGEPGPAWHGLPPTQKRRAIGKAIAALLRHRLRAAPVMLAIEDLHVADRESIRLLESVLQQFDLQRLIVCASYRPAFTHRWGDSHQFTEFAITALPAAAMHSIASTLLGAAPSLRDTRETLVLKAAGNPFFLQQLAMNLIDAGSLGGTPGNYALQGPLKKLNVPASIASVVGARVDHLPAQAKFVVEAAAILGDFVTPELLGPMIEAGRPAVELALRAATDAGLLSPPPPGSVAFSFSHSLVQESVSASLTHARRQWLHRKACEGLLAGPEAERDEHAAIILQHAMGGEVWQQAVELALSAMSRAIAHSANREAVGSFELGLQAAARVADDPAILPRELGLRIKALSALLPLGRMEDILANLERADAIARRLGDDQRLAALQMQLAVIHWTQGNYAIGLDAAQQAATAAARVHNTGLEMAAAQARLMLQHGAGRYAQVIAEARRMERKFAAHLGESELIPGWAVMAPVGVKVFLADSLARTGDRPAAQDAIDACYRELARQEHAFSRVLTDVIQAAIWSESARHDAVVTLLQDTVRLCRTHDLSTMLPPAIAALGGALARSGRVAEGVALLERAVGDKISLHGGRYNEFYIPVNLGIALTLAGRHGDAIAAATQAVAATRAFGQLGHHADALYVLAEAELGAGNRAAAITQFKAARQAATVCGMTALLHRATLQMEKISAPLAILATGTAAGAATVGTVGKPPAAGRAGKAARKPNQTQRSSNA